MKYRVLKRCNDLKVSEIALGCEGFIGKTAEEFRAINDLLCVDGLGITGKGQDMKNDTQLFGLVLLMAIIKGKADKPVIAHLFIGSASVRLAL